MDYTILLFYISILLIIYGFNLQKKQQNKIKRKVNIPKIKYTGQSDNYSKLFDNIFITDNELLKRI